MGRPKTPTGLAVVRGIRKDRINTLEPVPAMAEVVAPEWLRGTDAAMAEWNRLAPDLISKQILTHWDAEAFAEYCSAVATVALAARHLADEGHLITVDVFDRNGKPSGERTVTNPWHQVQKAALEVSARRAAKFGLTPSDRSGVKAVAPLSESDRIAERFFTQ